MIQDQISRLFDKLQKIQQNGDFFEEGNICFKIGVFLRASGDLVESSKYVFSALQLAEESACTPLCVKSCEELVRIFAFLNLPILSQYYFNRIFYYIDRKVEKNAEIMPSFSYLLDVLNYSRIFNSDCIYSFFLDTINSSFDKINLNRSKGTENRIELSIFLKVLQLFRNCNSVDIDSESVYDLLKEEPKSAKLYYYSLFTNGFYHKGNKNYGKALEFFEKQLKIAKELRDFHLVLFSYCDLMQCHFYLEDFNLYHTTFLIIKDLVKGKKELEGILLNGKFYEDIIDSLNVIKRPSLIINHIPLTKFLVNFFRRMKGEYQALEESIKEDEFFQLCQTLPREKLVINALEFFFDLSLKHIPKGLDFSFNSLKPFTNDCSDPFVLRFIYWNLKNGREISSLDGTIKSKLLSLQNTKNLLVLNELIKIFNLSKLADTKKSFERFCHFSNVNIQNPLEGFDYFAFRRPSKNLTALVNNFNMKSKSQSSTTGLSIPNSNFLPSPTFFGSERASNDEEFDLDESFGSCSIHEAIHEQPRFSFLKNGLRVLDLCCSQLQHHPSFIELKSLTSLTLSGLASTLLISSHSLEEIALVFCDLERCVFSNCSKLSSIFFNFSKIEFILGLDSKCVELNMISSEVKVKQIDPSTKKVKLS